MQLTPALLKVIADTRADPANINSIIVSLDKFGDKLGMNQPHRLAQYGAQLGHESGGFRYDAEVWGPTTAQTKYDSRKDLGNTPEIDGDGEKYKGRTAVQVTGKANYKAFCDWCIVQDFNPPDFVERPELINTDPWEGLVPLWYWTTRKLNDYADQGDIEMITRRINGGLNGYEDRLKRYDALGLAILRYPQGTTGIKLLQKDAQAAGLLPVDTADKTQIDGISGPKTRAAIHQMLVKLGTVPLGDTKAAPVTEAIPVAVAVAGTDKVTLPRIGLGTIITGTPLVAFAGLDTVGKLIIVAAITVIAVALLWKYEWIAQRVKGIVGSFNFGGGNA